MKLGYMYGLEVVLFLLSIWASLVVFPLFYLPFDELDVFLNRLFSKLMRK